MASLIFSHAKSIVNKAKKTAAQRADFNHTNFGSDYKETYQQVYNANLAIAFREFEEFLEVSTSLHNKYMEFVRPPTDKAYFITIRPDDSKCTFENFHAKVLDFVKRKCFVTYALSFEQKGTSDETLGSGFHCHIVAKMKQRTKGEVLRDTLSSWKKYIDDGILAANCIDVNITNNGEELIQNYLIEYKSDDDHKDCTKEWDAKWRQQIGCPEIIRGCLPEK